MLGRIEAAAGAPDDDGAQAATALAALFASAARTALEYSAKLVTRLGGAATQESGAGGGAGIVEGETGAGREVTGFLIGVPN